MENVIVRLCDMPCTIKGTTSEDSDGDYNIYINARLNYVQQHAALRHELSHAKLGDFSSDEDLLTKERRADSCRKFHIKTD